MQLYQAPPDFFSDFDIEGHRGCRGLLPENSIPAFVKALELGVNTLEMDVVITKDKQVLVSHDPYFSHEFCRTPGGLDIPEAKEKEYNLYNMTYEEIRKYDCGMKPHPRFPSQKKIAVIKPLLGEVISTIENLIREKGYHQVHYNIEIKSTVEGDFIFHPGVEEFSDLLMAVLIERGIEKRTIVQCFDVRALRYVRKNYPDQVLSYLIENTQSPEENLHLLGFTPQIYSPDYIQVDQHLIQLGKKLQMKIIPWTINDLPTILKLKSAGVDGIITDYPDIVLNEKK
jgi:glycerophosphoryl diester phosphodiesterase